MVYLKQIKIACIGYILISIVFYITGFLCILNPAVIYTYSRILAEIILIAYGIIKIIGYFSKDLYCLAFQYDFAGGLFLIILGILILIDSLLSIQTALDSKRFGLSSWKYILILSILAGTLGVSIILKNTITLAGCALLAEGCIKHYIVMTTTRMSDYHYLDDNE